MKLRWTEGALAELYNAREYIAAENPYAAKDVVECIASALLQLTSYPRMGRIGQLANTRELVITGTPFIAVYTIQENTIEILALIHHARAWPEEL